VSARLHHIIVVFLLISGCESVVNDELVQIPDAAFLQALMDEGVDLDGDGQISSQEAEQTTVIRIAPVGVTDLTGIEAFVNLDTLIVNLNPVDTMDLSKNRALRYLQCRYCELTTLRVTGNEALTVLDCGRNKLDHLDLSGNPLLRELYCNNNRLASLDVTENSDLNTLISCGNQLTYLDISGNRKLTKIGIDNMPTLLEVCVWTLPFPPAGVTVLSGFSPNVSYTTTCNSD
jgi:hypothetical protein